MILLTGSRGYLGGTLMPHLKKRRFRIREIDACWYTDKKPSNKMYISSLTSTNYYSTVIHLAWYSSAGNHFKEGQDFSLKQTKHLANLASRDKSKFVFASTASVFGKSGNVCTEATEPSPCCYYGEAKLAAEEYLKKVIPPADLLIFRFGTLMGKGLVRTRLDLVVNTLLHQAKNKGQITIQNPRTMRPLLHVEDAAATVANFFDTTSGIIHASVGNITIEGMVSAILSEVECDVIYQGDTADARDYKLGTIRDSVYSQYITKNLKDCMDVMDVQDSPECYNRSIIDKWLPK